uniref:Uncharacterized protein n=1 Tax=Tetraselmis sp. GSL018 TaxID=582737 RepID=A0A061RBH3_9CHLO
MRRMVLSQIWDACNTSTWNIYHQSP